MKVALIGNGPVSDDQRKEIDTFDVVIRLARINNYKPDEKMTHLCLDGLGMRKGNPRYKGLYLDTELKNRRNTWCFWIKIGISSLKRTEKWDSRERAFISEFLKRSRLIKSLKCVNLSLGVKSFTYARTFGCPIHLLDSIGTP